MNTCPNCNRPYQPGDEVCRTCGFILPLTSPIISTGEVLQARYEIQELVHSGGMGYVYLATDKRLYDRICIVKQIKEPIKSDDHRKKLEEEALRMSKLDHPNVAMILDHFIDSGYYFLVVERIHGKTLSEVFKERRGHLTENEVVAWATSICDVVSYLHHEGIVHRDISPDNIMLTGEGSIKFIDFGTLREFRHIAPGGTVGIGKYGYTPPEQWQGKPEPRSDIFSLGATIYYLLSGFLPLSREYTTRQAPQKEDFNPSFPPVRTKNPNVSPQFEAVLQKALQLNVNDRYSSASEFGEALRNLGQIEIKAKKMQALSVKTKPKAVEVRPKPISKSKPIRISQPKARMPLIWAFISLGIVLFLMAGAGGIYFVSGHQLTPSSTSPPETITPPPDTTASPPETASSPDTTWPVISQVTIAEYTGETTIITWTTDEDSSGQVEYGTTDVYGKLAATDGALTTSHSIELTGLQPNTTYHFKVKATDRSGNQTVSGDNTFNSGVSQKDWKVYVNDQYGFSIKYPSAWVDNPSILTTPYHLAAFQVSGFVPGVAIMAFDADAPESNDWIIKTFRLMKDTNIKVVTPLKEETLLDGTKAYTYRVKYISSTQYEITAYILDANKDGNRIRLDVFTVDESSPYDEKLFSQVAHTLRFTSPPAPQVTPATTPTPSQTPAPPPPAALSFKAKTYTNDKYGFSIQYPSNWVDRPDVVGASPFNVASFTVPNFIPGVGASVFPADAPVTKDWAVKALTSLGNADSKVVGDVTEGTLADGTTKAYTCQIKYTSATGYEVLGYMLVADKGSDRITVRYYTIDAFEPYNAKLASEIVHTLRFTSEK